MKASLTLINIAYLTMMSCSGFSAVTSYRNRKKFENVRFFYIYPLASFLQMLIYYAVYASSLDYKTMDAIACSGVNIFLLVEFIMIFYFLLKVLKSSTLKAFLYVIGILYLSLLYYFWFEKSHLYNQPKNIFIYQAFVILIPCVFYFLELLKTLLSTRLSEDFTFWIATGVIFYFGCTLPLFLVLKFEMNANYLESSYVYFINYFCYSIFFLLIAKAYLCPQKPTS